MEASSEATSVLRPAMRLVMVSRGLSFFWTTGAAKAEPRVRAAAMTPVNFILTVLVGC